MLTGSIPATRKLLERNGLAISDIDLATIVAEMERRDVELGLVTMCCGGGLGTGTLMQRIS